MKETGLTAVLSGCTEGNYLPGGGGLSVCHLLCWHFLSLSYKDNRCFVFLHPQLFVQLFFCSPAEMIGVIYPNPRSHSWLITPTLPSDMNPLQTRRPVKTETSTDCKDVNGFTFFIYHAARGQSFKTRTWAIISCFISSLWMTNKTN